jgi:uncharacterized protein (TIGR03083 family)
MKPLEAIRRESELFYATARGADPELGVPSCPDWSIADLVWHLGEVHWFWAAIIERRATGPEEVESDKPVRPDGYGDLQAWAHAQMEYLLRQLDENDDATAVWTWALNEKDHTVGFIRRHQVQEAAVHRWDMQNAATTDRPTPIPADEASDSIDELLAITMPWSINEKKPIAGSVHLHCTDADGEWFVHRDGRVEPIHAKGDVALRGTASNLLLTIYKRESLDSIEVIGDETLGREFIDRIDGS